MESQQILCWLDYETFSASFSLLSALPFHFYVVLKHQLMIR